MTTGPPPPELRLGARCEVGGRHRATVRYIGPVDGQAGEWVGLEWDDPARGKHDGSYGGRRYFFCGSGQAAGSFVRLGKLLEAASFGCTLLEAVRRRYAAVAVASDAAAAPQEQAASEHGRRSSAGEDGMYVSAAGGRRVAVELVGAHKVAARLADLAALRKAAVVGEGVSQLGDPAELSAALPSLEELDLADNLVGDWAFVDGLLRALPALRALNPSCNRLALPPWAPLSTPPPAPPLQQPAQLPSLSVLVLNGCGVGWPRVVGVAQRLPSLRELHLCGNGIASLQLPVSPASASALAGAGATAAGGGGGGGSSSLSAPQQHLAAAFPALEILDLEGNGLRDWGEVQLLGTLPALRALLLSGNALPAVAYSQGFTTLSTLLLGANRVAHWLSVDQLDRFPALADVRLSDNPLMEGLGNAGRYEVIARVGKLTTLNASEVTKAERWDAELSYLRIITDELAAAPDEAARQRLLALHPRFPALTAKYGPLAAAPAAAGAGGGAGAGGATSGSSLARSMVELVLCHGGKEVRKKLPVSLTVGKLKLMIEKLLRVRAASQALLLLPPLLLAAAGTAGAAGQPEDITDEDSRELRYFSPVDGSRIEVSEADPAARAEALQRAKQEAAERHQLRMEEQEKMIQQFRAVEERLMV